MVGPTLDYVPKEIGSRTLSENGRPGGWRHYAHDIIAYEVIEGVKGRARSPPRSGGESYCGDASSDRRGKPSRMPWSSAGNRSNSPISFGSAIT